MKIVADAVLFCCCFDDPIDVPMLLWWYFVDADRESWSEINLVV